MGTGHALYIRFSATLARLGAAAGYEPGVVLRLPRAVSAELPSRGMSMISGTLNGVHFWAVVEPDDEGSHWFRVNDALLKTARVDVGNTVELEIATTKEGPEPRLPAEFEEALAADPSLHELWMDITLMARWDWVRWMGAARQQETRSRRIKNTCSMLKAGKRRPCCFDRNQCTLTDA